MALWGFLTVPCFPSSYSISKGRCKIMASPLSLTNQWPVLPRHGCLLNSKTVLVHELSYISMLAKWETWVFFWSVHQSTSSPADRFNMLCHLICLKGSRPALLTYRLHHDWRGRFSAIRGRGPCADYTRLVKAERAAGWMEEEETEDNGEEEEGKEKEEG